MKKSDIRTYGRHKQRVIVADNWLTDHNPQLQRVFSTSSESSKNSIFHSSSSNSDVWNESLNSTGDQTGGRRPPTRYLKSFKPLHVADNYVQGSLYTTFLSSKVFIAVGLLF